MPGTNGRAILECRPPIWRPGHLEYARMVAYAFHSQTRSEHASLEVGHEFGHTRFECVLLRVGQAIVVAHEPGNPFIRRRGCSAAPSVRGERLRHPRISRPGPPRSRHRPRALPSATPASRTMPGRGRSFLRLGEAESPPA